MHVCIVVFSNLGAVFSNISIIRWATWPENCLLRNYYFQEGTFQILLAGSVMFSRQCKGVTNAWTQYLHFVSV
jgi:hypothetical protein